MEGSTCPKSSEKDQLKDKNAQFSSFGKWLSPICTKTFTDRIAQTGQDKYIKKLTTPAYLKLFLHAQLQRRDGLRDIPRHIAPRNTKLLRNLPLSFKRRIKIHSTEKE
ncbi:DUF4372 domain-containing protein [Paenibacillus sp. LPE1-1-1.1]